MLCLQHRKGSSSAGASDLSSETCIVVQAVCATKLPTLTFEDVERFRGLLRDIFPGTPLSDASNPELEAALKQAAVEMRLQLTNQQVRLSFASIP